MSFYVNVTSPRDRLLLKNYKTFYQIFLKPKQSFYITLSFQITEIAFLLSKSTSHHAFQRKTVVLRPGALLLISAYKITVIYLNRRTPILKQ